jgi:hypothetical protein
MRNMTKIITAILVMAGLWAFSVIGKAQDVSGPVPWVSHIKGKDNSLMIKQSDTDWFEATVNTPIGEGDVVFQDKGGFSEVYIDKGTYLRLDANSGVQFDRLSDNEIRVVVTRGKVVASNGRGAPLMLDVPGQTVAVNAGAKAKIMVKDNGGTEVAAKRGKVTVEGPKGRFRLNPGQTLKADEYGDNVQLDRTYDSDSFDAWSNRRDTALVVAAPPTTIVTYMPEPVAADLSVHGVWVNDPGYGWVWRPRVVAGWAPYRDGRWVHRPAWGWTWVSYEPWGWYPYHYGRWVHVNSGWCWVPVRVRARWSPALVFWVEGPDYIAWQPLPYNVTLAMTWHWGPTHVHRYVNHHHLTAVHYHNFHRGHYHHHHVHHNHLAGHPVKRVVKSPTHVAHRSIDVRHHSTPRAAGYVAKARAPRDQAVYAHHRPADARSGASVARVNYGRNNAASRADVNKRNVKNPPRPSTNRTTGHADSRPRVDNTAYGNKRVNMPADRNYGHKPDVERKAGHTGMPDTRATQTRKSAPTDINPRTYGNTDSRPNADRPNVNKKRPERPADHNTTRKNSRPNTNVNQPRANPQHNRSTPGRDIYKRDHKKSTSGSSRSSVKSSRPGSSQKTYKSRPSSSSRSKSSSGKGRSSGSSRSGSHRRPR